MRLPPWLRRHLAALRALLALTVVCGIIYPLVITGIVQLPGLQAKADGSMVTVDGRVVGSRLIGQSFDGDRRYFRGRPSAGDHDPTASGASNLGPEDIVDRPGRPSLLTQVCARSKTIGRREHVSGARPFCAASGVGAVLAVYRTHAVSVNEPCPARPFLATYRGLPVECARRGIDYTKAKIVPVRGNAPAHPAVPADAVTASGSGLDPHISPAYARLQAPRIARVRGIAPREVLRMIASNTTGRTLGFMGEPHVNVLELNLELDSYS